MVPDLFIYVNHPVTTTSKCLHQCGTPVATISGVLSPLKIEH